MFDNPLLTTILAEPDAPALLVSLQNALETEQQKRHAFYAQVDENRKMEFINGEIVMQSPVTLFHNRATGRLYKLLDTYVTKHKLGIVGIEKLLIRLTRNDYEPDICFFGNEKVQALQGTTKLFPVPDFVVEVLSPSTEKTDRTTKLKDYALHQIREYWLIEPEKQYIEQYLLTANNDYELNLKAKQGKVQSLVIEGFNLEIAAIFDDPKCDEEMRRLLS